MAVCLVAAVSFFSFVRGSVGGRGSAVNNAAAGDTHQLAFELNASQMTAVGAQLCRLAWVAVGAHQLNFELSASQMAAARVSQICELRGGERRVDGHER